MQVADRNSPRVTSNPLASDSAKPTTPPAASTHGARPAVAYADTYAGRVGTHTQTNRAARVASPAPTAFSPGDLRVAAVVVPKVIPRYAGYGRQHQAALVREHDEYVAAIEGLGFRVMTFDNDPEWLASIFPEDPAVVIDAKNVVITVPGSDHRTGEHAAMAEFFRKEWPAMKRHDMSAVRGARLDGGDVLRIGRHLYIGLSDCTNLTGAAFLAKVAEGAGLTPHLTPLTGGLHLKSSCTLAADNRVFFNPKLINPQFRREIERRHVCEPVEHLGSNVLYLGRSPTTGQPSAVVSKSAPGTAQRLCDLGLAVAEVEKQAHEALDGRVTCSSVRIPEAESWCG